jgi:hypothetical protein
LFYGTALRDFSEYRNNHCPGFRLVIEEIAGGRGASYQGWIVYMAGGWLAS